MVDTNWGDFADRGYALNDDTLLVMDAGGGGINIPLGAIAHANAAGHYGLGIANPGYRLEASVNSPDRGIVASFQSGGSAGCQVLLRQEGVGYWAFGMPVGVLGWSIWSGRFAGSDGTELFRVDFQGNIRPGVDSAAAVGTPAARYSTVYAASGTINTSDRDAKQQIGAIPEEWLDAWANVNWGRFKMNAAVAAKGADAARWHFGLVAQEVRDVLDAEGIDGRAWGLLCYDQWAEESEPVMREVPKVRQVPTQVLQPAGELDGQPVFRPVLQMVDEPYTEMEPTGERTVTKPAGDRWGIRYDLAQAIEAAYQRRRADRLESALEALAARVDALAA